MKEKGLYLLIRRILQVGILRNSPEFNYDQYCNFSSIVGPNGSGKSNVIDSMLFVFGYRSQKIRSKKLSALIHKSSLHKHLDFCTVEVHFQLIIDKDSEEFTLVPDSNFVVSRTAQKDGSSSYHVTVNGKTKRSQFSDVQKLLKSYNIDLDHNRFLILQGEVEQISLMKPKGVAEGDEGMLEYLEDIIGTAHYKEQIEDLAKRVDELDEQRMEKLNRVKAMEKEKSGLEGPKNEAVKFLRMENGLIRQKHKLYQIYLMEYQKQSKGAQDVKDVAKNALGEIEARLGKLKDESEVKRSQFKQIQEDIDRMTKEREKLTEQYNQMEQKDERIRLDIKHRKNRTIKLQKALEAEKAKLKELREQPEKTAKEVKFLEERKRTIEADKAEWEAKLQEGTKALRVETKDMQASKEKQEKALMQVEKIVNETKSKLDIAKAELDLCLRQQTAEQKRLDDMQAVLKNVATTFEDKQRIRADLTKRVPGTEKELKVQQEQLKQLTEKELSIATAVRAGRQKVEEARAALSASKSQNNVVEALLEQKRRGKINGIKGRLGDLGAIDAKYDVAISTACPQLDNIVVDAIETGQHCVNFLKKANVGVATFIGLDKMGAAANNMKTPFKSPENVPRLFDLVRVEDESIRPAFYFALRDTLVAENLDQATRIGLQGSTRYRVVTLKGELVDPSGTMSGGGSRPIRGRIGNQVKQAPEISPDRLAALDTNVADQTKELQECRQQKMEAEAGVERLTTALVQMRRELQSCEMELKSSVDQKANLERQIAGQKNTLKAATAAVGNTTALEADVAKKQKDFDEASEKAAEGKAEVKLLTDSIMKISERLIGSVEKKLASLRRDYEDAQKNITKATVAEKNAERNLKKTEEKVESMNQEVEENEQAKGELDKLYNQLTDEAANVVQRIDSLTAEQKEIEQNAGGLRKDVLRFDEEEQAILNTQIEEKGRLEAAEKTLKDIAQKHKYWQHELDKCTLHDLSDLLGDPPTTSAVATAASAENDDAGSSADDSRDEGVTELNGHGNGSDGALVMFDLDLLEALDTDQLKYEITMAEQELGQMKPNMNAIDEYRRKAKQYLERVAELTQATDQRNSCRQEYDRLKGERLHMFLGAFSSISMKLKEMYRTITLGGDAELELVDSMDPFSEGVVFSVRPPKKSWKQISNLSGGEKTLSSLALVFALHHFKPTPFYVMDEIDAALDFKNVSIVAAYIKERTKDAQFIVISLRNNMFELANRLIGIYKTYDVTKSVTMNPSLIPLPCAKPPCPRPAPARNNAPMGPDPAPIPNGAPANPTTSKSAQAIEEGISEEEEGSPWVGRNPDFMVPETPETPVIA